MIWISTHKWNDQHESKRMDLFRTPTAFMALGSEAQFQPWIYHIMAWQIETPVGIQIIHALTWG